MSGRISLLRKKRIYRKIENVFYKKKQYLVKINNLYELIFNTLYELSINIQKNFEKKFISKTDLNSIMSKIANIERIILKLKDRPITYKTKNKLCIELKLIYLKQELANICSDVGTSNIGTLLKLFDYKQTNSEYIKFLNKKFIPLNVNIITHPKVLSEIADLRKSQNIYDCSIPFASRIYPFNTNLLIEKIYGAKIFFPISSTKVIQINGYFLKDYTNVARHDIVLKDKFSSLLISLNSINAPKSFKYQYLEQITLRDWFCYGVHELSSKIKCANEELKRIKKKNLSMLVKEFTSSTVEKQRRILILLLLSDEDDQYMAHLIYDMITRDALFTKSNSNELFNSMPWHIQKLFRVASIQAEKKKFELMKLSEDNISFEDRLAMLRAEDKIKTKCMEKIKEIKSSRDGSAKAEKYVSGFLKIPFGTYIEEPILSFLDEYGQKLKNQINKINPELKKYDDLTCYEDFYIEFDFITYYYNIKERTTSKLIEEFIFFLSSKLDKLNDLLVSLKKQVHYPRIVNYNKKRITNFYETLIGLYYDLIQYIKEWYEYKKDKIQYLRNVEGYLDDCVYGNDDAKKQMKRLVAQWINGRNTGTVFGLQGPPGTGKTTIIKKGLSKCLQDDNGNPRPFCFIPLGGSSSGSMLEGHGYTYVGSTWGRITDGLMDAKCMNPIIYFDEVDKISRTERGKEIVGILTHLTDPSQNKEYYDRYFAGVPLDLSKAIIVFAYNDSNLLDPILKDRITEIRIKALSNLEKIKIAKDYLLPELLEMVGYKNEDIIFPSEEILYIIETYTYEAGVRKLKEKLLEIVQEINLRKTLDEPIYLPYKVTKEFIEEVFSKKHKVIVKKIAKAPHVGMVNGLYATSAGTGGLTIIQVYKIPCETKLKLELTGQQGNVMQESMKVAKTVSWTIIPDEMKAKIQDEFKTIGSYGLHIHCPQGATPKDGPSAGAAITSAIISRLCNIPIRNTVAMTGEIDLQGNVTAIGGLGSKLDGAKRAGATKVLIPKENIKDYELWINKKAKIARENSFGDLCNLTDDDTFDVIPVENIDQVLEHIFVDHDINFNKICS